MKHDSVREKLMDARIPTYAYSTNLAELSQPLLRAIVTDAAYVSQGVLKSISITESYRAPAGTFPVIVARFAAELCLCGQKVCFVRMEALIRELRVYGSGVESPLHPVLSRMGEGFIVVPDITPTPHAATVADFLLDHVSRGGGVVLGFPDVSKQYAETELTKEFTAFTSTTINIQVGA